MHPGETWTNAGAKSYDMNFSYNHINTETCWDNLRPDSMKGQDCRFPEPQDVVDCPQTDDFRVELYSLDMQKETGIEGPASLGYHIVTREMIQCLGQDKIKVHFEYGKR
jgi:hypothetical protein